MVKILWPEIKHCRSNSNQNLCSPKLSVNTKTLTLIYSMCSALGRAADGFEWSRDACAGARTSGLLERKQARACRSSPDIMQTLVQAARDTSAVCQQAFRNQRWNCSSIDRAPDFTPELLTGKSVVTDRVRKTWFFWNSMWFDIEYGLILYVSILSSQTPRYSYGFRGLIK